MEDRTGQPDDHPTAVVNVFVTKPLEIDEPSWCAGHHDNDHAEYKVDISHDGPEHVIAPNGREMFRAFLTQSPFASTDRAVGLYVEVGDLTGRLTPVEVERFADDLTTAAEQLRGLGRQLAEILAGGAR
ncbi:DUF6907 domain-containing protein [Streptomyces europaeiscabiei]|uniref:DUF6907 domain-containing protein n=1 Tax=Streptomyces europaeiscabiei TaxID=146819 RepID=UPI0038F65C8D